MALCFAFFGLSVDAAPTHVGSTSDATSPHQSPPTTPRPAPPVDPLYFAPVDAKYDLQGVMHHTSGNASAQSGHYYACMRMEGDTWRIYSDLLVKTVDSTAVLTKDAVLLSYARRV